MSQGGPAQSSNPACPSIPSSSPGTLNLQDSDHEGQTPASRCSRSPAAAATQRPVQTPPSGPRCSGRPGPAAAETGIGLRGSRCGARLLPPRAQPRPAPPPARALPVCSRAAVSPDGGRREVPPPPPERAGRADRASASSGSSGFAWRRPAPRRKPARSGPPPTLPAAANGPRQPRSRARPLAVEDRADAGVPGGRATAAKIPGRRLRLNLDLPRGSCRVRSWELSGTGEEGKCVSASALQSHAHTQSQPFRRQFEMTSQSCCRVDSD